MRTTSDDLFLLIKSLTKTEKRYFKLFSRIYSGQKKYIQLFDIIEQQEIYDEKAILEKFKKERFTRNFSVAKAYLYDMILKSMEGFLDNVEFELRSLLNRIQILHEKGLYLQCKKVIEQAKKIADKNERHLYLLELSDWEDYFNTASSYVTKSKEDIQKKFEESYTYVNQYKNIKEYGFQRALLHKKFAETGRVRKASDLAELKTIISHPLFTKEEQALSFESKFTFYHCKSGYFFHVNDYSSASLLLKKLIKLMETNSQIIKNNPQQYILALANFITCQGNLRKYNEIPPIIEKLRNFPHPSEKFKMQVNSIAFSHELKLYIQTGEFDTGVRRLKEFKMDMGDIKNEMRRIDLYFTIAYIYFGAKKYPEANKYINYILHDTVNTDATGAFYSFAKIFTIIIHYEMNNYELLPYLVKSCYQYLYKNELLYNTEKIFLNYMHLQLPKIKTKKELINSFKELKTQLETAAKDPFEKDVLGDIDFISWLESKIENKPLAEIMKRAR